jgi:hypothetical protein
MGHRQAAACPARPRTERGPARPGVRRRLRDRRAHPHGRLGLDATGIDLAARFLRHDALDLAALGQSCDTVLDSLIFHCPDRACYVEGLRAVTAPGGRCFLLAVRDEPPNRSARVHRETPDEIHAAFADGWSIDAIDAVTVDSNLPAPADRIRGWRTTLTRL